MLYPINPEKDHGITRDLLIRAAEACGVSDDDAVALIIADFQKAGRYAIATQDEIELFDEAFDAASY